MRRATRTMLIAALVLAGCDNGNDDTSTSSAQLSPLETNAPSTVAETPTPTTTMEAIGEGALWTDVTGQTIGTTGEWSNKVELADIDLDGDVDILFAEGGDYETPGTPVASQVWINDGSGSFEDHSEEVLGDEPGLA